MRLSTVAILTTFGGLVSAISCNTRDDCPGDQVCCGAQLPSSPLDTVGAIYPDT